MRTVVDGRRAARLLVPGALLFLALGSPAVGAADGADSRAVAGPGSGLTIGGGVVLPPPSESGCVDRDRGTSLWDNLFPTCNRDTDPVTMGGGLQ
ncbi:hypothetical protein [Micromonospora sp. NPDC047074]|uniref:hypothetical protein n=1 Tax=Micromonospora sp. NPDC047074 TaxID=3154339 RepID=UPI0034092183